MAFRGVKRNKAELIKTLGEYPPRYVAYFHDIQSDHSLAIKMPIKKSSFRTLLEQTTHNDFAQ